MSRAKASHRRTFLELCTGLSQATDIPIDEQNIQATLGGNGGWAFVDGQSMACTAFADPALLDRANAAGLPLLAMLVGAPQLRPGFEDANTFALKIADQRLETLSRNDGMVHFPAALDLFANGRLVLEVFGLRLDTHGRSHYQPEGTLSGDLRSITTSVPEHFAIVSTLIASFPDGANASIAMIKHRAMSELTSD